MKKRMLSVLAGFLASAAPAHRLRFRRRVQHIRQRRPDGARGERVLLGRVHRRPT